MNEIYALARKLEDKIEGYVWIHTVYRATENDMEYALTAQSLIIPEYFDTKDEFIERLEELLAR